MFRERLVRSLCNVDVPTVHDGEPANATDDQSTDAEDSDDDILSFEYHRFISLDKTSSSAYCKLQFREIIRTIKNVESVKLLFVSKAETAFSNGTVLTLRQQEKNGYRLILPQLFILK